MVAKSGATLSSQIKYLQKELRSKDEIINQTLTLLSNITNTELQSKNDIVNKLIDASIHAFFINNTFVSNARLKLATKSGKSKQHPEAELLLFENYLHYLSTLSTKNNRTYSKK